MVTSDELTVLDRLTSWTQVTVDLLFTKWGTCKYTFLTKLLYLLHNTWCFLVRVKRHNCPMSHNVNLNTFFCQFFYFYCKFNFFSVCCSSNQGHIDRTISRKFSLFRHNLFTNDDRSRRFVGFASFQSTRRKELF